MGGKLFVALEPTLRQGVADRLLDLALDAHSERLEEPANAAVEHVFVHDRLRCAIINASKVPTGRGAEGTAVTRIMRPFLVGDAGGRPGSAAKKLVDRLSTKAKVEDGKSVTSSAQPNCAS